MIAPAGARACLLAYPLKLSAGWPWPFSRTLPPHRPVSLLRDLRSFGWLRVSLRVCSGSSNVICFGAEASAPVPAVNTHCSVAAGREVALYASDRALPALGESPA